jgi:small subunit ribosomal protein S3
MGQKVSPIGLRVGVIRDWESRWFANKKDYAKLLHSDIKIREYLEKRLKNASTSKIDIERKKNRIEIFVHTAKPGIVIGRGGKDIEQVKKEVEKIAGMKVNVSVVEIKRAELDAKLVAENIARQIENRASFRVVQKRAIQRTMKAGAKGIKTLVSGRLGGVDMARKEGYTEGNVPLQTIRADIDYALVEADTTYGKIGVKVWIYKGEVLPTKGNEYQETQKNRKPRHKRNFKKEAK